MENTSGQGSAAVVPGEINRWNWGAFLLNWIWGIGNQTFIAFLMFVPFMNLIMPFVLGAKGNQWAWRNKRWESVEHFKAIQREWAKWGLIVYTLVLGVMIAIFVGLFFGLTSLMKGDAYQLAIARLNTNQEVSQVIGKPFSTGMVMGSVHVSGRSGSADISFSIEGPKGEGVVYVNAIKDLGQWKISRLVLVDESTDRHIYLTR